MLRRTTYILFGRRSYGQCLYRGPLVQSLESRRLHTSRGALSNAAEPMLPEAPERDRFSEMMDDRTNALLRSLGVNIKDLEESVRSKPRKQAATSVADAQAGSASSVEAKNDISPAVEKLTPPLPKKVNSPPTTLYFDTQDVYSDLRTAGLTPGQAEVIMRTMQVLIQELVDTCKDRSVPVSASDNEAYLFDAASSEVRNEISNSRLMQSTSYRAALARLQRDVEILEHEANEMTSLLKSDLDIEVHERKNSARAEENVIRLKIQDLNNKIATRLNSELKSEIENLRWQITRRSLTAIAIIVLSIIWLTQTSTKSKTAKHQVRQRQTSTLKEGRVIPVPVLAPSMSLDEPDEPAVIRVEDLPSMSGRSRSDEQSYNQNADPVVDQADRSTASAEDDSTNLSSSSRTSYVDAAGPSHEVFSDRAAADRVEDGVEESGTRDDEEASEK